MFCLAVQWPGAARRVQAHTEHTGAAARTLSQAGAGRRHHQLANGTCLLPVAGGSRVCLAGSAVCRVQQTALTLILHWCRRRRRDVDLNPEASVHRLHRQLAAALLEVGRVCCQCLVHLSAAVTDGSDVSTAKLTAGSHA